MTDTRYVIDHLEIAPDAASLIVTFVEPDSGTDVVRETKNWVIDATLIDRGRERVQSILEDICELLDEAYREQRQQRKGIR